MALSLCVSAKCPGTLNVEACSSWGQMRALRGKISVLQGKLNEREGVTDCKEREKDKSKNGGVSGFLVYLVLQHNGKDPIIH